MRLQSNPEDCPAELKASALRCVQSKLREEGENVSQL